MPLEVVEKRIELSFQGPRLPEESAFSLVFQSRFFGTLLEQPGVEGQRSWDVNGEVSGIVAAWVDVKFVRDSAGRKDFIKRGRAGFKAVIILIATIKINLQPGEIRGARQRERAIGLPKSRVRRSAENCAENA